MSIIQLLATSVARTLWVHTWADWDEKYGTESRSGVELMDVAPETPRMALLLAGMLLGRYTELNGGGYTPARLLCRITENDGIEWGDGLCHHYYNGSVEEKEAAIRYVSDVGHYLAMMALGTGVSLFDVSPRIAINIPRLELSIDDFFTQHEWDTSNYKTQMAQQLEKEE